MSDDERRRRSPTKVDELGQGLTLELGDVDVQSAGPPANDQQGGAAVGARRDAAYVDDAILAPLEDGKVGRDYAKVFDAAVANVRRPAGTRRRVTETATGSIKPVTGAPRQRFASTVWLTRPARSCLSRPRSG